MDVTDAAVESAESGELTTVEGLRKCRFDPKPAAFKCRRCDVRHICNAARTR